MTHNAGQDFAGSARPFPTNHVIGVIDELQEAEEAVQALRDAGYPARDIVLIPSQTFIDAMQKVRQETNRVTQVLHVFFNSSYEGFPGDLYLEQARAGRQVLSVYASTAERAQEIARVLSKYHMHLLRYYSLFTVTDLSSL